MEKRRYYIYKQKLFYVMSSPSLLRRSMNNGVGRNWGEGKSQLSQEIKPIGSLAFCFHHTITKHVVEGSSLRQNDNKETRLQGVYCWFHRLLQISRTGEVEELMCFHSEWSRYETDKSNTWVIQTLELFKARWNQQYYQKMVIPFLKDSHHNCFRSLSHIHDLDSISYFVIIW